MGKLSILLALISFGFCLWWRLKDNIKRIKTGEKINHKKETVIRAPFIIITIILLATPIGWEGLVVTVPMILLLWWLLFDGLLGIKLFNNFWSTGTEDGEDDAKTDNLLQRLKPIEHKILKTVPLGILLLTYIAWLW